MFFWSEPYPNYPGFWLIQK